MHLTEAGRYFPDQRSGVAQTSGTFFSIQAGCTSKPLSDSAAGACSSFSSRGGCFGGDFGDDDATLGLARAAQWQRDNPDLAERQAEFFHSLWDDPPARAAPWVAKEELAAGAASLGRALA